MRLNHLGDTTGEYTLFMKNDDGPDKFDILNEEEMSSKVAYINHHYGVARRNKIKVVSTVTSKTSFKAMAG